MGNCVQGYVHSSVFWPNINPVSCKIEGEILTRKHSGACNHKGLVDGRDISKSFKIQHKHLDFRPVLLTQLKIKKFRLQTY